MNTTIAFTGALALTLASAGCNLPSINTSVSSLESTIAQDLPAACAAISAADQVFQGIVATQAAAGRPLASTVVRNEATAVKSAAVPCANPTIAGSTAGLIASAVKIYGIVMQQIAAAKQ